MPNRFVCLTAEQSVARLCQLEARPICGGDRCIPTQLETSARVCLSSLCSHRQVCSESMRRTEHHSVGDLPLKAQTWFPVLLDLAVEHPLSLPKRQDLLKDHLNRVYPLAGQGNLQLVAWKVSGDSFQRQEFHSYRITGRRVEPRHKHGL